MSDISCAHLDQVSDAIKNYKSVLAFYVTCVSKDAREKKAAGARCNLCQSSNRRMHACLECEFLGCFDDKCHMKDHALKNKHYVAINLNHGSLFCFECDDYIYYETFEDIFKDYKLEARRIDGGHFYLPWKPKKEEIGLLNKIKKARKNKIKIISDGSYIGLRGLVNIGTSCYVNCIIQVLMHIPVLKDSFFVEKHECFLKGFCLRCEMFALFQEFYSGESIPYDLAVLPKFCESYLGIQHQDAFLLFQEILIGLHKSCQKTDETDNCTCMIHDIFFGVNQSSTKCSCGASSDLPVDHFMDILINLDSKDDSLVNILDRKYLEPELLSDFTCSNCKSCMSTYLKLTIKKLPEVICFRMNWFNWTSNHFKTSRLQTTTSKFQKISTAFRFEETIDMSPYLNSKKDIKLSNSSTSNSYAGENMYRLFAGVSHKHGHYTAYVQQLNRWYECVDAFIYKRSLEDVHKSEPYLLFYYKQK